MEIARGRRSEWTNLFEFIQAKQLRIENFKEVRLLLALAGARGRAAVFQAESGGGVGGAGAGARGCFKLLGRGGGLKVLAGFSAGGQLGNSDAMNYLPLAWEGGSAALPPLPRCGPAPTTLPAPPRADLSLASLPPCRRACVCL